MNPLKELADRDSRSGWIISGAILIRSGELKRLVEEDGIRGVTSNPTIFEKAIAGSTDYDDGAARVARARSASAEVGNLYEALAIEDIQMAADVLRPVYDATHGDDGYVSFEVSPHLAHDTERTINEAKRLSAAVDRPNVMIKVPATPAGIPAIEQLIAEGVNVNVTLMFSMSHYEAVARAYIKGLERCGDPARSRRWHLSLSAGSTRWWTRRWKRPATPRPKRWWAKSPSPIRKSFTGASWKFFTAKDSRRCASAARACSGRYGRARERKIPLTPMCSTSKI